MVGASGLTSGRVLAEDEMQHSFPVLLVGDDLEQCRIARILIEREWYGARLIPVLGEGAELLEKARAKLSQYIQPGLDAHGVVIVDLHWGSSATMMGCDLVHWLRASGYHQPIIIWSAYEVESVAAFLPKELGLRRWTKDTPYEPPPKPLTQSQMALAEATANRLLHDAQIPSKMNRIRQEAKRGLPGYGSRPVAWEHIECVLSDLQPVPDAPQRLHEAYQSLSEAVGHRDAKGVIHASSVFEAAVSA